MRQELGSNQVQGVDYAYTLQGWIKGINSNALDATKDMGHDGSGSGLNGRFARDVASFSLSYYEGDFSSVSSTGAFSSVVGSDLEAESRNLYNGNIRIMQTTLMENNGSGGLTASNLGMAYKYDQLNRLKQAKGFTQYTPSTNTWSASSGAAGEHNNFFTFDANGNILTQQRYEGSTLVDNLTYQYATNSAGDLLSNRLYSVDDAVTNASLSATDMEDMPAYINATPNTSNNYTYTQIGELKSDAQEEIQEIVWRVDSKISEITRTSGSSKKNLKFEYDAMGNRVVKHVYAGSVLESSTYYVRDAQGNVMGVYEHKMDAENAVMEYKLIERNIYGSAQVGICKDTVDLNITNAAGALTQATYYHARQLNHRQYSLSNHLGNVLTTIGDGKAAVDSNSDGVIDYYTAYIISVSDYSPFGVELASRTWSIEEYRNGFNGKELDKEVMGGGSSTYDYGFRIFNSQIARFLSVDPLFKEFPELTPYQFASNTPIIAIDIDGLEGENYLIPTKVAIYGVEGLAFNNANDLVDVQYQQYRLLIKNPSNGVNYLYNKIQSDIGAIFNTDYGKFRYEKQAKPEKLSENDFIRIDPSQFGLMDMFVKVVGVQTKLGRNNNIESFSLQFRTLEGHAEVGEISFSASVKKDNYGNSFLHFMIESNSQIAPTLAIVISGFSESLRDQQMDNWSQTMGNVIQQLGGVKMESGVYYEHYNNTPFWTEFEPIENNPKSIGTPVVKNLCGNWKELPAMTGSK